ncbi:MAG: hypothetical protein MZV63_71335 [Marinilabiliales bacterium]|nr:hypothetical protein [Marinilabiliales bacterium]
MQLNRTMPGGDLNARDMRADYMTGAGRIDGQPLPPEKMSTDFSFIILALSLLVIN